MENPEMMSKGKKWLIGTGIVLVYMFSVWLFLLVNSLGLLNGIVMLYFDAPVVFGYFVFCISLFFSKNQPFLPQKETIKSQITKAFIVIPIIAIIMWAVLILPYFK